MPLQYDLLGEHIEGNYTRGKYDESINDSKRTRVKTNRFIEEQSREHTYKERSDRKQKRKRQIKRKREIAKDSDSESEGDVSNQPNNRRKCGVHQFIFQDSDDDDNDRYIEKERKRNIMRKRHDNMKTCEMIDNDVCQQSIDKVKDQDEYLSVEEGGSTFHLLSELKEQEKKNDDTYDIAQTRELLKSNYIANQMSKRRERSLDLARNRQETLEEPLYDAELSEDEVDTKEKTNPIEIGGINVSGCNNSIAINIFQKAKEPIHGVSPMTMHHTGSSMMMHHMMGQSHHCPTMYNPSSLFLGPGHQHRHYNHMPRFLMNEQASYYETNYWQRQALEQQQQQQQQQRQPQRLSIERMIQTKVNGFYHLLGESDRDWLDRIIDVARSTDARKLNYRQSDWIYNQRRQLKGDRGCWKTSLLTMLK